MSGKLIDISRAIAPDALVYPGDPPLSMRRRSHAGAEYTYSLLELGWTTHFLTHLDVPRHFVEGGASVDDLPLDRFLGPAEVIAVDGPVVLPAHIPPECRGLNLLFRTRNSQDWDPRHYNEQHVYIGAAAAELMVSRGVNLAGIDYLSADRYGDESYPAHRTLLGNGVLILEGIDLSGAPPGRYTLLALPLKIVQGDGSPVRAALLPA